MKCGISTSCLYPMETKESLQTLTDMGFQEFEVFFNTFREIQSSYTLEMRKRLDDYGAVMRSIHPFTSGFESALILQIIVRVFWMVWNFISSILKQLIY